MLSGLIELIREISTPVKLGWLIWIVWCAVQIVWYRRGRAILAQPQRQAPRIDVKAAVPANPDPATVSAASKASKRRRRPAIDTSDAVAGPV